MVGRCGADREVNVTDWPNECTEVQKCPNPECGTDNLHLQFNDRLGEKYRVICRHCSMCGPQSRSPGHAIDLWNALTTESSWISVEDHLPNPGDFVRLRVEGKDWGLGCLKHNGEWTYQQLIGEWATLTERTVTHWKPKIGYRANVEIKRDSWISVEDELPEDDGPVIAAWHEDGESYVAESVYYVNGETFCVRGEFPEVTHWRPLPDGPVVEGTDDKSTLKHGLRKIMDRFSSMCSDIDEMCESIDELIDQVCEDLKNDSHT